MWKTDLAEVTVGVHGRRSYTVVVYYTYSLSMSVELSENTHPEHDRSYNVQITFISEPRRPIYCMLVYRSP